MDVLEGCVRAWAVNLNTINEGEKAMALMRRQQQSPSRQSSPFGQLALLRNEIDRLFESPFDFGSSELLQGWLPAVEISENNDQYLVKAEVPGVNPGEIDITVHENTLTISGEKKQEQKEGEGENYRTERFYGRFQRSITLPHGVDANKIEASYKDGVLTIKLPKSEQAKPKQIQVKAEGQSQTNKGQR